MNQKNKFSLELLLHITFWSLVYYSIVWLSSIIYFDNVVVNGVEKFTYYTKTFYLLSAYILVSLMLFFYVNTFLILGNKKLNSITAKIVITFFLTIAMYLLVNFSVKNFLLSIFCDENEWDHIARNVVLMFGFIGAISMTYYFVKDWIKNETLRKQLQSLQISTELSFLKSQINPHFLFNTLNNLFAMAQEKQNDELAFAIDKLSGMMRYMIYESNVEKVPLSKEIEYLKSFIALNKLRFGDNEAKIDFKFPANSNNVSIAPMLLVPFIENAFKYGVMINEESEIKIDLRIDESGISFICENTDYSHVKKMNEDVKGIGLENVRRRLELLYRDSSSLQISNENKKHIVILKLFRL